MPQQPRTRRGLAMWLSSTMTPVFVLDDRRRVLFFNKGCERLTGWEAGDVIGQACDFVSEPDPTQVESITGTICPPPEVFDGKQQNVAVHVPNRSGDHVPQLVRFFPLLNDEDRVERVLGTFSSIPEPSESDSGADRELHTALAALRSDLQQRYAISTAVGTSRAFHRLMEQVLLASKHTSSVHFVGEPGTRKEHLARLIHYHGDSRRQAFVPLDCQHLTREEIKLAVREALRDAREQQATRLSPGTLFLKHVELLPDSVQELLLEEASSVFGVGPSKVSAHSMGTAPPLLRLMSSSQLNLSDAVTADRFSDELMFLLTAQQISVPALRERPDDILLLAQHFLESLNRDQDKQVTGLAEDVIKAFRKYGWPGNEDEVREVVTDARESCQRSTITLSDLPFQFRAGQDAQAVGPLRPVEISPLEEHLAAIERQHIELALRQAGDNKSQAAASLGITRARLYRRMEILGISDST
ncbi:MAG: sigma 54-interacting transcriptional regulator [Planctomycetaceae bacterium]|nr:sigma 54-interacting transcriptional regulator [Planctomycetaceae bacterium]